MPVSERCDAGWREWEVPSEVPARSIWANDAEPLHLARQTYSVMSKRKERIALKDQRDFKKFLTTVGIIVIVLLIVVYLIFQGIAR